MSDPRSRKIPTPTSPVAGAAIDFNEKFDTLPKPPIVEALVMISGRAEAEWIQATTGTLLQGAVADYPKVQHLNTSRFQFQLAATPSAAPPVTAPSSAGAEAVALQPSATAADLGWAGTRCISTDDKQVVTFMRDSFTFSRLAPYTCWGELVEETMRLWQKYATIAQVRGVGAINVRFINRLEVPENEQGGLDPSLYFEGFGTPPPGMGRGPFLHQDMLRLTQFPKYFVSLVRTADGQAPLTPGRVPLILDLEAICDEQLPADAGTIKARLAELHWVKNRAFFASVTEAYRKLCR